MQFDEKYYLSNSNFTKILPMKNKHFYIMTLLCAGIFNPVIAAGQQPAFPESKRPLMELETIDDPYLPNAWQNKKTSPPFQFSQNTSAKLTGTSIYTAQVNVDGAGNNILGDAANEPGLALNPLNPDAMVIGWRQFDNVASNFRQAGWSYSADAGLSWTFPGVIDPGVFRSDPVLDYDLQGNFYYNSLTPYPEFFCKVYQSGDGGAAWNDGTDAGGGDKQWMAIDRTAGDGSGNIYAFWSVSSSSCLPGSFTRSEDNNLSYEDCIEINGDPYFGNMTINNAGELYIVSAGDAEDGLEVIKSVNVSAPGSVINWETPVEVYMDGYISIGEDVNPDGLLGQANIDVDRSGGPGEGNVYVLASLARVTGSDNGDVMFSKSSDGGSTWSDPIKINDDTSPTKTQWLGTMSVAPNGRIDAVWLDNREAPAGSEISALYYSYSLDQGETWSVNEKLSEVFDPHLGYPNQDKMGDYFDMISDETGAFLAWANTLNGEEDVYYSHILPDLGAITNITGISYDQITIVPNPTNGEFIITGINDISNVEICNAIGAVLFNTNIFSDASPMNISNLPSGIYFIKITMENGSSVIKKIIRN